MGGYEVDPVRLAGDGKNLAETGDALAAAVHALESALSSSGQMCGDDPAGKAFALRYRQGGQALFSATEAAVNACRKVGHGVEVSASNYAHSEAASTVGGAEPSVPPPGEPPKFSGPTMPNPFGPAVGEPMLWAVVRQFVGSPWPDGNPATLRAAAAAWRTFGSAIAGVTGAIGSCTSDLSGHDIPELANITGAVTKLSSGVQSFGKQCESIASSLDSFAGEVESSQNAIRDLLHKLSPSGMAEEVVGFFTGHNPMDDIKKIADDIKKILHTLKGEADSVSTLFQDAMTELDSLTTELENWARKEFTHYLGNTVGNAVANEFTAYLDLGEGGLKSVLGTVGSLGDLVTHPQDLAKLAAMGNPATAPLMLAQQAMKFGADPKGFIDQKLDMAKGMVDAKDWMSDHPLRGAGYVGGTLAQLAIPGAGEAKAATEAAKVADEAAQGARLESQAARAGEGIAGAGAESGIAAKGSSIARDLNSIDVKASEVAAPARPPEPGPLARPAEPAPTPGGASGGVGAGRPPVDAPPAPHVGGESGAAGGGVREPAPMPAADRSAPTSAVAGGGVHEPAPVGSAAHPAPSVEAPHSAAPSLPAPDGYASEPTFAGAHSPQAAPVSPAPEPIPDAYPGGPHPPDPPPHDPGGPGGGDGHGGGGHAGGGDEGGGHGGGGDDGGHGGGGGGDGNGGGDDGHGGTDDGHPGSHPNSPGEHPVSEPESAGPVEGRDYGFSPSNAFEHLQNPADEITRLNEGGVPAKLTDGYDPLAGRSIEEFEREFTVVDKDGNLRWDWETQAPENGFADPPTVTDHIPEGHLLDRLGSNKGGFMADEGAPLATRAMPPGVANEYHTFVGTGQPVPDGLPWEVQYGPAKDAFGQPGGANQWAVIDKTTGYPVPVEELLDAGLIDEPGAITRPGRPR